MLEIVIASYVAFALVATIVVVRSEHLERSQLFYQLAANWLVPFLGAVCILVFHSVVHTNMTTKAEPYLGSDNSDDLLGSDFDADMD